MNRRSFVWVGVGLIALFAAVGTSVLFMAGEGVLEARMPPGMGIAVDPESRRGVVAGLAMATDLIGILALSLWAAAGASDYSTGWIRLMVQAEPRRWRLLAGKLFALTGFTLIGTFLATVISIVLAYPLAEAAGLSTALWSEGMAGTILSGWTNLTLATLIWGIVGLTVAVVSRSAVVATAGGIGYIIVLEGVLSFASEGATRYMPGSIITTVGAGGTADLSYPTALAWAVGLAVLSLGAMVHVFHDRDITS